MDQKSTWVVCRTALAGAVLLMATSCASTQEMTELRAMAQEAQQSAARLESRVQAAEDAASRAMAAAEQAEQAAQDAMASADAAQLCCDENRERIDRMFERLQQK